MLLSMLSSNCSICHMIISTKETQLRQEQGTGGSRRPPQIPVSVRGRIKCGVTSLIQSSTDASGAVQHLSYSPPDGDGGLRKTEYPPAPRSSYWVPGSGLRHWRLLPLASLRSPGTLTIRCLHGPAVATHSAYFSL